MKSDPHWPDAGCCWPDYPGGCICPPSEKALRAWKRGEITTPMNADQREFCLTEIGQVEGYTRADHAEDNDADLASAVLDAWTDYARDKGLI